VTDRSPSRIPVVQHDAAAGGLIFDGSDQVDRLRFAAGYVDCSMRGTRPADLSAQAAVRFELVINLKTAKALSLEPPPMLLARTDKVIE